MGIQGLLLHLTVEDGPRNRLEGSEKLTFSPHYQVRSVRPCLGACQVLNLPKPTLCSRWSVRWLGAQVTQRRSGLSIWDLSASLPH